MQPVVLQINGEMHYIQIEPTWTLLHVLRERLGFTGTKCGCDSAQCGACKVIVDGQAVNSCSVLARKAEGAVIETIEGMAAPDGTLHIIQQAFIDGGAVQCGYCTPGMVMSAKALLDKNPNPTEDDVRRGIDKNLCRCTGYVKIVASILAAAQQMRVRRG